MNFIEAMAQIDDGKIVSNNFDNEYYSKSPHWPDNLSSVHAKKYSDWWSWQIVKTIHPDLLIAKWRIIDL